MWARRCSESWHGCGRSGSRRMNKAHQFLHQLRRDPPAGFAVRLKWQLDRPVPTRTSRARLLLVFAIFGTAFALVSPQARRAFGDLFHNVADGPQTMTPGSGGSAVPQAPSTPALSGIDGPRGAPLSRSAAAQPNSAGPGSLPAETPHSPQAVIPDAQPIDEAFTGSRFVVAPNPLSTPQMPAAEAAGADSPGTLQSFVPGDAAAGFDVGGTHAGRHANCQDQRLSLEQTIEHDPGGFSKRHEGVRRGYPRTE